MNRKWKYWLGVAAAAGLAGAGRAQVAAPPPPAAVAVPAAPAPAAVPVDPNMPGGMMGNLIKTCAYCKAKCCNSQLGQLLNNTLRPVSALSGGLVPPLCPPNAVNPADLGLPPDSPAGAAARIKADQAGAAARVAAVRYLAHVDCHYWPEAQAALITALRADRNECVRLAAAIALQTGCCCNPATMTALTITVSGGEEDGNPSETSDRVKSAASVALENCLSRVPPAPPLELLPPPVVPDKDREKERREKGREQLPPPDPDGPAPAGGTGPVSPVTFYQQAEKASSAAVIRKARQALEQNKLHPPVAAAAPAGALGSQGLVGLAMNAMGSTPSAPASPAGVATVPAPAPVVMAPTPAAPADVRRVEAVKDQQPPLVPVPAPARQPAAPPAPAHARPVIPTPAPSVTPISWQFAPPAPPAQAPAAPRPAQVARPTPPAPPGPSVADLASILERGTRAEDRGWAADQLRTADWHANPQVVLLLLTGARRDPEASVRLSCLGTLGRMKVDTPEAVTTYHTVAAVDADARVREAALQALSHVQPAGSHRP